MLRREIYDSIISTFEHNYSWLGKQFAEEFLLSAASWNIQQFSNPPFRIRRHLLLYWPAGWLKSSLLEQAYNLLGNSLCTMMTDVTLAALRGTVEHGKFISPYTLKRPFSICTEFGQLISGSEHIEMIQKLLNVLEEGVVTVSLGKISSLSEVERIEASNRYGIVFIDENTFTYRTNWILLAGTYNRKFLVDNAFESRFTVVTPDKELDSELAKYITSTKREAFDEDVIYNFRSVLMEEHPLDISDVKLPDEVFEVFKDITIRQCSQLISYRLCRAWWGIKTTKEELVELAKKLKSKNDALWKSADDKVFEAIENNPKTAKEIAHETKLSLRQVYYSLKNLRATRVLEDGIVKWTL